MSQNVWARAWLWLATAIGLLSSTTKAQSRSPCDTNARVDSSTTLLVRYTRCERFTVHEGTWMSVDLSPDGKTLVFDLLGDLYTLPVSGGKARRITSGPGFDAHPRFSPDGTRIVFESDRSGSENLYTVRSDGSGIRAVSTESQMRYASPTWTPDGKGIVVARATFEAGVQFALYLYPADGGTGIRMSEVPRDDRPIPNRQGIMGGTILGPVYDASGRYLYFSKSDSTHAITPHQRLRWDWKIQRFDLVTGEQQTLAGRSGGALRPAVSPDGRWLVYGSRHDSVTGLRLQDLRTRDERWLVDNAQRDDMSSRYTHDVMPGSVFTPDSKALITTFGGRIWRVDVPSGARTEIPFEADVALELGKRVHFEYSVDDSVLTVSQIRDPQLSPNNRVVAFTAMDHVYVMDLAQRVAKRLTRDTLREQQPAWSPDGKWIAYAGSNDSTSAVYRVRADGGGRPQQLTQDDGYYRRPVYDPSGTRVVAERSLEPQWFGNPLRSETDLVWLRVDGKGGDIQRIADVQLAWGVFPTVAPYFVRDDSARVYLGSQSMSWTGEDFRVQPSLPAITTISPRRDRYIGFDEPPPFAPLLLGRIATSGVRNVDLRATGTAFSPTVLAPRGAEFPAWSPDGSKIIWATGRSLYIYDVGRCDSLPANCQPDRIQVTVQVPVDRPQGTLVLKNARIVTMDGEKGETIFERGDIVVTRSRIVAVGAAGAVRIPSGATELDMSGKTIIPGFVDVHAHPNPPLGAHAWQPWTYSAALAWGVTTIRDPQPSTTDFLTYADIVALGEMRGPRIYSTGPAVTRGRDVSTVDKARDLVRLFTNEYHVKTLKQYLVGDRRMRQNLLVAAAEARLTPTLEGGRDFQKNLTEAIDGYGGSEHAYPVWPLYKDVVELVARSGISYTPTLLINYGGPEAEMQMYDRYQGMRNDPKMRRFVPLGELDKRFVNGDRWYADDQYTQQQVAAQAAKIVKAGGHVALGGHGEMPGLGEHWELWMLQSGGMAPLEALRCATFNGAEALGMDKDLGSITVGKLADLVILDQNPLADIHNSTAIRFVMKNGILYDGETLDEVWPRKRTFGRQWWNRLQ